MTWQYSDMLPSNNVTGKSSRNVYRYVMRNLKKIKYGISLKEMASKSLCSFISKSQKYLSRTQCVRNIIEIKKLARCIH